MIIAGKRGFTLIEMALVLVITGLAIVGIIYGKEIIRSAQVQSSVSEMQNFRTQVGAFKLQYNDVPGDFSEATVYWGSATADGNGDTSIEALERYRAWQHLELAELNSEHFTGEPALAPPWMRVGVNVHASAFDGAGYIFGYDTILGHSGNFLSLGKPYNGELEGKLLEPSQAFMIDNKMDDGHPGIGAVLGVNGENAVGGECVTATTPREYVLDSTSNDCVVILWIGY